MAEDSVSGQSTNQPTGSGDANVEAALGLGWHMEEIHGVVPVPEGPEHPREQHTLAGLGDLSSYRRQLLGLNQIDFALAQLKGATTWPDTGKVTFPDTDAARKALAAIENGTAPGADGPTAYLRAVEALHLDLMVALEAANPSWGSAYRLGRGLADTTRRMDNTDLEDAFDDGRIGHLVAATGDLATLLPAHAGKAVATSLGWWHTEICQALQAFPSGVTGPIEITQDDPPRRRAALEAHDEQHRMAAGWRSTRNDVAAVRPQWHKAPTLPAETVPPLDIETLKRSLPRQGKVWRGVLTGEMSPTDRLEPDDYLAAAKGLANQAFRLARKAPPIVWVTGAAIAALAVLVVILIGFATTSSGAGRFAAGFGGLIAALLAGWKVIKNRTVGALKQLEQPLWGAELDRAIADAITLPPVGAPRPNQWVELAIQGAYQAAETVAKADTGKT